MLRIILMLTALCAFSCVTSSKDAVVVSPGPLNGVYEDSLWKADDRYDRTQLDFSSSGSLIFRSYHIGQCIDCEGSGKWKIVGDSLFAYDQQERCRTGFSLCSDSMPTVFKPIPNSSARIRNILEASFEMWSAGSDATPGQWVSWNKI